MKKERIDQLLVERGLAPSRVKAQALVLAGQVVVDDHRIEKPGTRVSVESQIRLKGEALKYVSRGGLKLEAALQTFALDVRGAVCADIGASTGGFTDCLLQAGAARVYALDVGTAQLHARLRSDARVISTEGINVRTLPDDALPEPLDVVVVDVSFISVRLVLPKPLQRLKPGGVLVALVKPQFEAGPEHVEKGGVVRDDAVRQRVVDDVAAFLTRGGLQVVGTVDSPIEGPAGNREVLLVARR